MKNVKALFAGVLVVAGMFVAAPAQATVGVPAGDGERRYVAKIEVGDAGRACSGALIEQRWVVTAASCFVDDPAQYASLAAGAPASPTVVTVGRTDLSGTSGQVRDVVELVPRPDRDLVLARLSAPVYDITPVALGAVAPAAGDELAVAGYGRTADEWVPDRMHVGGFTVTGTRETELDIDGGDSAAVCAGDAGGPAVRAGAAGDELVAVSSRSWQGGCLGSEETRRGAVETRLDDITDWIGVQVARWSLLSDANRKYVSARVTAAGDQAGRLQAISDAVGGWEQFTLHTRDGGTTVALRSEANRLFVSAELNRTGTYQSMLRARAEVLTGGWEFYTLVPQGGQKYALQSTANGMYVATEASYTGDDVGLLRARSASVAGGWERFTLAHADTLRVVGADPAGPTPLPAG